MKSLKTIYKKVNCVQESFVIITEYAAGWVYCSSECHDEDGKAPICRCTTTPSSAQPPTGTHPSTKPIDQKAALPEAFVRRPEATWQIGGEWG
jgi:hypothetical protein